MRPPLRGHLALITGPTTEPVTLDEAKAHLRVTTRDVTEEDRIERLIRVARAHLDGRDGWLGRALVPQVWEVRFDRFPWSDSDEIQIPLPPLLAVQSVKYDDDAGVEQTLDAAAYAVDSASEPGRLVLVEGQSWPTTQEQQPHAVRIRFRAGYEIGSPAVVNVPEPIRDAILLGVEALYDGHEQWPAAAQALLSPYAVWSLA